VVAGADPAGLEGGRVALRLLVEVAPRDDVFGSADHEGDGGVARRSALEAVEERGHHRSDLPPDGGVTQRMSM
jgi:hypothetical protein